MAPKLKGVVQRLVKANSSPISLAVSVLPACFCVAAWLIALDRGRWQRW
jgi:hypothetical protein